MFSRSKHDCFKDILRGAVCCEHAFGGVWLGLSDDRRSFVIEEDHALTPAQLNFAAMLAPGDGSASGNAIVQRHRVVIRDVAEDYAGVHKEMALAAGIHAVTSTPLIDSRFLAVGVIALYHSKPHHPSYNVARRLDAVCHVASQLSEVFVRLRPGALSPAGRQAADTVARLLQTCGRDAVDDAVYLTLSRYLGTVLQELSS